MTTANARTNPFVAKWRRPLRSGILALMLLVVVARAHAAPFYSGGAAATAHPTATAAALAVLAQGGNAVDAAVAAAFAMGVVDPFYNGIGGGGFALLHLAKSGEDFAVDFRETAPGRATRTMYEKASSVDGPLAVAVPGAVKGYLEIHKRYGRLPRARLIAAAIRAARDGFTVTPRYREFAQSREACLRADPDATKIFLPGGVVPALGALIRQPALAKTLETISREGESAFYTGSIGKRLVANLESKGGIITLKDLRDYTVRWRTPLEGSYRGYRFISMPPPSGGGLLLVQLFGIIEKLGKEGPAARTPEALHTFIEALKLVTETRLKYVADPDFVKVDTEKLISPEYIAELASRITPTAASPAIGQPGAKDAGTATPPPDAGKNTTHISVIDADGNAVAMTTTLNYGFGSCVVAGDTGVLLNDEMDDFTTKPGAANAFGLVMGPQNEIAPGKRPLSSMSPTIVFAHDAPKRAMIAIGAPGGPTIPTSVAQVLSHIIDAKRDVVTAVSLGRVHHQYLPPEAWVDSVGIDLATKEALEARGHRWKSFPRWGDVEVVLWDPVSGFFTAAADPRNEGLGAGVRALP